MTEELTLVRPESDYILLYYLYDLLFLSGLYKVLLEFYVFRSGNTTVEPRMKRFYLIFFSFFKFSMSVHKRTKLII